MARVAGPFRLITVTTAEPTGTPAEPFSDLAPDEYGIRYRRGSTDLVLSATSSVPALLWAFDSEIALWGVLERIFQVTTRTITTFDLDKIPRAGTGFSSLHVQYPAGVSGTAPIFEARTLRVIVP